MSYSSWKIDQLTVENEQLRDRVQELTRENERLKREREQAEIALSIERRLSPRTAAQILEEMQERKKAEELREREARWDEYYRSLNRD